MFWQTINYVKVGLEANVLRLPLLPLTGADCDK